MTITLRELATGKPVGAGHVAQRIIGSRLGGWYEVDNWSEGTCKVYARPSGHIAPAPVAEFNPSELGLYIGHERGQPISEIKWGGQPATARQLALVTEIVEAWQRRCTLRPGAEDIEAEAARAMREIAAALEI